MSAWRREALQRLPNHKRTIEQAESPMALWIELRGVCERALENDPIAEEDAGAIFAYARHCLESRHPDLPTAVACAFYENIVTSEAVQAHIHRWVSGQEFRDLEPIFRYHLDEEEFTRFASKVEANRVAYSKERSRS